MTSARQLLFAALFLGCAALDASSELAGIWRHSEKPVLIQFELESGVGRATILRHDENPAASGLLLMKGIVVSDPGGSWTGNIYSGETDTFVKVDLQIREEGDLVIVEFDDQGRPTEILRLVREPTRVAADE